MQDEEGYIKWLAEMPDEQRKFLDEFAKIAKEFGLSPDEAADTFTKVLNAREAGKSEDEIVAELLGRS
jgi:hypothetical protein